MKFCFIVEKYDLENPEFAYDIVPEIIDGQNISDYVDPDVLSKLERLEMEEDMRIAELEAEDNFQEQMTAGDELDLDHELEDAASTVQTRRERAKMMNRMRPRVTPLPRNRVRVCLLFLSSLHMLPV